MVAMLFFVCCALLQLLHGLQVAPAVGFRRLSLHKTIVTRPISILKLCDATSDKGFEPADQQTDDASPISVVEETPVEKARREQLERIQELKDKEVFVKRNTGKYECQACGYIYDESKGYEKKGIAPGTPFEAIEKFRCPQCGANKKYFVPETEIVSGFKDNLKYGLGANALTSGQKSLLIFGGLLLGFAVFMGGYLLE